MTNHRDEQFVITRYDYDDEADRKSYWQAFSLRQAMRLYERIKREGADEIQICRVEFTYEKPEEQTDD
jgi:hypothetical protein